MPVTNFANRTLEPRHALVPNVGAYSAAHPSDSGKATVGSRGPPLVITQSCGSRMLLRQQFVNNNSIK